MSGSYHTGPPRNAEQGGKEGDLDADQGRMKHVLLVRWFNTPGGRGFRFHVFGFTKKNSHCEE
jgi:hypothetical protein